MIVDEGEPALLGIGRAHGAAPAQVLRDRAGGNPDSQFQLQFVGDAFLSPRGILRRHLADQRLEVVGQAWSARRLRLPTPEEAESLAVPTQERIRLDIHQRVAPGEPLTQSRQHPAGGSVGPSRPDLPLLEQGQLLSQEEVLGH